MPSSLFRSRAQRLTSLLGLTAPPQGVDKYRQGVVNAAEQPEYRQSKRPSHGIPCRRNELSRCFHQDFSRFQESMHAIKPQELPDIDARNIFAAGFLKNSLATDAASYTLQYKVKTVQSL